MKQSRYVHAPESCLRDSPAEAKEHRELEVMRYSYCLMKLLSSQLFTIASQQVLVTCWVQISGFYCLWATAESTLSRNSPLSWEFHHLGGWHSEESRQAGGGRRLPASISASHCSFVLLVFSFIQELGDSQDCGMYPLRMLRAHCNLDPLQLFILGRSKHTPCRTEWGEDRAGYQQCLFILSTNL